MLKAKGSQQNNPLPSHPPESLQRLCYAELPLWLWLLDSLLPASFLSLAAQLCLLPGLSSSSLQLLSYFSLAHLPQEIPIKSARLLPSSSWNHSPTLTIPCALFIGELIGLVALGLLLSAYHSENPFLDASC
ncbi:hypothetical protein G5714_013108 [Onychostoma macrolepis]|uniref:Uncharacterized protein n=1 Tax=Onychostoma macrolepis TaxID=369639 RepID=A0A7J6CEC4_9TELE|nr:hypothetical protein G5714_013108 [Onychostoma macrolepis]